MSRDPRELAQRIQKILRDNVVSNKWRDTPEFAEGELFVIQSILAAEMPRWVPVSEKLPEIGTEVLVINDNDEFGMEIVAIVKRNYIRAANNADYEDFGARKYTHWQPLPSPPREEAK